MAQFSGTDGKVYLNGKEIGAAVEWSLDAEPSEPDYVPIQIPNLAGLTAEFTSTFKWLLPCRITVKLPFIGEYALVGVCNQEQTRAYLESPIDNGYLLYHFSMDSKQLTLERREYDLKAARAWVMGNRDE